VAGLKRAFRQNQLTFFGPCQPLNEKKAFAAFLRTLFREDWVVYRRSRVSSIPSGQTEILTET
jgi:hypothetical protein